MNEIDKLLNWFGVQHDAEDAEINKALWNHQGFARFTMDEGSPWRCEKGEKFADACLSQHIEIKCCFIADVDNERLMIIAKNNGDSVCNADLYRDIISPCIPFNSSWYDVERDHSKAWG